MMLFGGISTNHDASISIIDDSGNIKFTSASERFTKKKHCRFHGPDTIKYIESCDNITWYQQKQNKSIKESFEFYTSLYHKNINLLKNIELHYFLNYNEMWTISNIVADNCLHHHKSHASAAFYTRPWASTDDTVILTIDCAGDALSNCIFTYNKFNNKFEFQHSDLNSIGRMWIAVASALGFNGNEVGSVMGLAGFGEPNCEHIIENLYDSYVYNQIHEKRKILLHKLRKLLNNFSREDIAASMQSFSEKHVLKYAKMARQYGSKLCYAGGVAQNIISNSQIRDLFDDMWIAPDPTDGGSALGCAAWAYCNYSGENKIKYQDAYLGYNINRKVNPKEVVDYLLKHKVCGIANGQAEWGPRALGNRSLIGDVRYDIKDTVNSIKKREKFRPFGPMILEEEFDKWFEGHTNGYMQFICKPKHDLSSVIHVDGTSRVQTVPPNSRSISRQILEEYFERTGIPMLLNTSLNIKGQPMLNDLNDVDEWEKKYDVKIF